MVNFLNPRTLTNSCNKEMMICKAPQSDSVCVGKYHRSRKDQFGIYGNYVLKDSDGYLYLKISSPDNGAGPDIPIYLTFKDNPSLEADDICQYSFGTSNNIDIDIYIKNLLNRFGSY